MSDDDKLKTYHRLMQAQQEWFFIFIVALLGSWVVGVLIFRHEFGGVIVAMLACGYLNHRFMTTHKCPFCGDNFFLLNRNKDYSEVKTIRNMPIQKVCVNCGEPTKKEVN